MGKKKKLTEIERQAIEDADTGLRLGVSEDSKTIVSLNGVSIVGLRIGCSDDGSTIIKTQGTVKITNKDGSEKDFTMLLLKQVNVDGVLTAVDWGLIDAIDRDTLMKGDNDEEKE